MSYSPEKNKEYLRERYAQQRKDFISYLGGACSSCGSLFDLQIDHIDPLVKAFPIGKLWATKDLPKVYQELEKCQLLCSWCHIDKTRKELQGERGFTHGTIYAWMKKKCQCEVCEAAKWKWHRERNERRRR